MPEFCHLHCHTHYSLLDGASRIDSMLAKAGELEIPAVAITDHGNLHGVPEFAVTARKYGIQAIIGCEFYLSDSMASRNNRKRYHQVLLAKNEEGYSNLIKLSSLSYTEGFYYKPRIDRETLAAHSSGLIATTCCLQGEVPQAILSKGEDRARALFETYLEIFGDDYYIELQDHGIAEQERVNDVLLRWTREYNVKTIVTNDVHYVDREDADAHDVLLCLQTGKDLSSPNRMRFENDQFYLKSEAEMREALGGVETVQLDRAIVGTREIADKCAFELHDVDLLMPHYPLPDEFAGDMPGYLRYLVFERAKIRYGEITQDITERIDHELAIINEMNFAGYFLIVQDFTTAARELDVRVGPGRGSAAGSLVAYCLGITDIDPLRYDLLFERFLNPERVSMPDIDIDFDDRGRGKVIDYVVDKYGRDSVCQIVTFGTMGARSAIRDVARVLGIPLPETDRIAKLIPDSANPKERSLAVALKKVPELRALQKDQDENIRNLLHFAQVLEGSARHTGVHAAGVIIAPGKVSDYVPVSVAKGKGLSGDTVVTQYDGSHIEKFGLLKMDFLGLKTLTILTDAIKLIEEKRGVQINTDDIPSSDPETFRLFQRADTVGIFQFESEGMRDWLVKLIPTSINDLIAMNALYRPGPMDLIPSYVDRKNGREKVSYPHPLLQNILEPTYGLPIYQEQVMQMAQVLAGYTLGGADKLRRAMGKKKQAAMDKERGIFVEGAMRNEVPEKKAHEIFDMMAKFAGYGFNKSHSAAYSLIAYQTAYLKAHYPPEFMAAVMTSELGDSKRIAIMMEECRRLGIDVLPPSIEHSESCFTVEGNSVRFGLLAIKGVGSNAIDEIIRARTEDGPFEDLFAFCAALDLRVVNKKAVDCLARSGALDSFKGHRAQIAAAVDDAFRHAQRVQSDIATGQNSLFGGVPEAQEALQPSLPSVPKWTRSELLKQERELMGFYVSGHPLEAYAPEVREFSTGFFGRPDTIDEGKAGKFCGIITEVNQRTTRNGRKMAFVTIEDLTGQGELMVFSEPFERTRAHLNVDELVMVTGVPDVRGGQVRIKVDDVIPMQRVRDQFVRSIILHVNADRLQSEDINELHDLCDRNRGNCKLFFDVESQKSGKPFRVRSRTFVVDPSPELMQGFVRLLGVNNIEIKGEA